MGIRNSLTSNNLRPFVLGAARVALPNAAKVLTEENQSTKSDSPRLQVSLHSILFESTDGANMQLESVGEAAG